MPLNDFMLLIEAKQWLVDKLEKGARCPCCSKYVKVKKIEFYPEYVGLLKNIKKIKCMEMEMRLLKFWGLIEKKDKDWGLSENGKLFLKNKFKIKRYILLYNREILKFEGDEIFAKDLKQVDFEDCYGV